MNQHFVFGIKNLKTNMFLKLGYGTVERATKDGYASEPSFFLTNPTPQNSQLPIWITTDATLAEEALDNYVTGRLKSDIHRPSFHPEGYELCDYVVMYVNLNDAPCGFVGQDYAQTSNKQVG